MPFKVGVTSGLYYIGRAEEISSPIKKLGYVITRGVSSMQLDLDVSHEVTYNEGRQIRAMAKKQGMEILVHGDLNVPIAMPERAEWRDANERITQSIRSAVLAGGKYVNFHTSMNTWLELMTYAGRKLTMVFCDHRGKFISGMLKESEELRDWFAENKRNLFARDLLTREEVNLVESKTSVKIKRERTNKMREELEKRGLTQEKISEYLATGDVSQAELREKIAKVEEDVEEYIREKSSQIQENILKDEMKRKLARGDKWDSEEMRGGVSVIDGYMLMFHYLFYTKDSQFVAMTEQYKELLNGNKYKLDYKNKKWPQWAWDKAEEDNDRDFKEFFYAACAAKFIEGHTKAALEWIDNVFIKKEIPELVKHIDESERKREIEELTRIAKAMIICYENPEARDPSHAGMHLMWRPNQIYATVKTMRKNLNTKNVMMLVDHEHLATQGVDALIESNNTISKISDFGEITIGVHTTPPNPLHGHSFIEFGDVILYKLLYNLRKTGLGKNGRMVYLIFERGGGDDPFKKSVTALRLIAKYLEEDVPPEKLPLEFFGMKGPVEGDINRQRQIISENSMNPLKDLMEMPDEDFTMLGRHAIGKGKRPEQWKKAELR